MTSAPHTHTEAARRILADYPYIDRAERFTGKSAREHRAATSRKGQPHND